MDKKDIMIELESVLNDAGWSSTPGDELVKLESGVQEVISKIRKDINSI